MKRSLSVMAAALAASFAFAGPAAAEYPDKPVTVIVPFGAGGGTDAVSRVLAEKLGEELGQRVVIQNRGGANGTLGATYVAHAKPDGYTLLMTTSTTHAANPSLMKELTYDPVEDFAPIARIGFFPFVLAVGKDVKAETAEDLIAEAKEKPGDLTFAHWQATTIVAGSTLREMADVDILGVAYKGTTPAVTDVLAGRVTMIFIDVPSGLPHFEAGNLRPLAATTEERTSLLPDLPSLNEGAVPGYNISSWMGFYAPKGTPADVVAKLESATEAALSDEAIRKKLAELGFDASPLGADDLGQYTAAEIDKWAKLVAAAGIEPK